MNRKKAVIFDMDGTVLNTLEDLYDSSNHIMSIHGYPERTMDEVRSFLGTGSRNLIKSMLPAGTGEEVIDSLTAEYSDYYTKHNTIKTRPYEGICDLLARLRAAGILTAVVSNKMDAGVQTLCSGMFPGLFDLAVGDRPGQRLKPYPDSVLAVLSELGVRKEDAVFVGDSETDMKTADNAGLEKIAVLWGFRDKQTLIDSNASLFAKNVKELETMIEKRLSDEKEFGLIFLGTGTAGRSPKALPGGEFEHCFDKSVRRCSSALLNGHVLIDCGPFTVSSLSIIGKPLDEITDVFFTHLHNDHYIKEAVEEVAAAKDAPLRVWVREDAVLPDIPNTEIHRMTERQTYDTPCGFRITGLRSNHEQKYAPQYLYFEFEHKNLLYATDGAWMLFETFYFLRDRHLDMLVWDCTVGDDPRNFRMAEHNSIPMLRLMKGSMEDFGIIDAKTEIWLQHVGKPGSCAHLATQEEIEEQVKPDGFRVAYDGLEIGL